MHTTNDIRSEDFTFTIDGGKADFLDVFPDFDKTDRVGIVVRSEGGVLGMSALLLASVMKFYDHFKKADLGNESGKLRLYPEFYVFHVGEYTGEYRQIDVFPPHRDVVVEDDSEQILEAVNDRGITRLLIEQQAASSPLFLRESISSAERRILTALSFSPDGAVENGDVTVTNNGSISKFAYRAYEETKSELGEDKSKDISYPVHELENGGEITQTYQRIPLGTAIRSLSNNENISPITEKYIESSAPGSSIRLK